jgi:hypothetical protein
MLSKFKGALLILVGISLSFQLIGCVSVHNPPDHHDDRDHAAAVDVNVHGQ